MRRLFSLITIVMFSMSAYAGLASNGFYIGKDIQFHRMDIEPKNTFNQNYVFYAPQLNLYGGVKLNESVAIEGGIYASKTLRPSPNCKLNNYGVHIGFVGFVPIMHDFSLLGGISASHLVVHARHEEFMYNEASLEGTASRPVKVTVSDHETGFNPRLMMGTQIDLTDVFSLRATGTWENTAFMSSRIITIFNSIHYSVGGLYRFE